MPENAEIDLIGMDDEVAPQEPVDLMGEINPMFS